MTDGTTPTPYVLLMLALFAVISLVQVMIARLRVSTKSSEADIKFKDEVIESSRINREEITKNADKLFDLQKSLTETQTKLLQKEIADEAMHRHVIELSADLDKSNARILVLSTENTKLKGKLEVLMSLVDPNEIEEVSKNT